MAKGRSPNYPSQTLAEVVERLRPAYNEIHTYVTPTEVFAENLGYTSLSGRALGLIATLKRYGLVDSEGKGQLRITALAVSIMELPEGSPERARALEQATFTPELFSELHEEFPDELPSDGLLRHHLVKKGFLPKAAEEIIRVFKANLDLVQESPEEYNPPMPTLDTSATSSGHVGPKERVFGAPHIAETNRRFLPQWEYIFNVSRDTQARVIFNSQVTQEAIDKLAKLLELQKDTFPTEAELRESEQYGGLSE